jgi:hypothetical protein
MRRRGIHRGAWQRGGVPLVARAQQPTIPVIGYLSARSSESDVAMLAAFRRGHAITLDHTLILAPFLSSVN